MESVKEESEEAMETVRGVEGETSKTSATSGSQRGRDQGRRERGGGGGNRPNVFISIEVTVIQTKSSMYVDANIDQTMILSFFIKT